MPLLQRDRELSVFRDRLDRACAGQGGVALVTGPIGIGKTSLLAAAADLARCRGMIVLTATGAPLERDYPYAVVRRLFEPLGLDRGAGAADLLLGAASLGLRAFASGPPPDHAPPDTFATIHGLYWLTANLAGRSPVLLMVDDCHWADGPSLRFLAYLAARLEGQRVLVLLAVRSGEPATAPEVLDELVDRTDPLQPAELAPDAAAALVRHQLGAEATDRFCAACHEATGGNPLLLSLMVSAVAADGTPPADAAVATVAALAPAGLRRMVERRLTLLPVGALAVARAVAVLGYRPPLRQVAQLSGVDFETAATAVQALQASGILAAGELLEFAHPVLRVAVDEGIGRLERARAHTAAAQLLASENASAERQAIHLLQTVPRGSAPVVRTLVTAARSAAERGAPEIAALYLQRAMEEPPPADARGVIQLELGLALLATRRDPAAPGLLRESVAQIEEPEARRDAALRATRSLGVAGYFDDAASFAPILLDPADADGRDRMLEAEILAGSWLTGSRVPLAMARTDRWRTVAPVDDIGYRLILVSLAYRSTAAPEPVRIAVDLLDRALVGDEIVRLESLVLTFAAMGLVIVDQLDRADRVCTALMEYGQRMGSPSVVASFAFPRAFARLSRGALADAEVDARWSFEQKFHMGPFGVHAWPLAMAVNTLVERGDLAGAQALVVEGMPDIALPENLGWALALEAKGRLRLAEGKPREAAAILLEAGARFERMQCRAPALTRWRAEAARALLRIGDVTEARRLADDYRNLAEHTGLARLRSVACRTSAELAAPAEREALLRDAVLCAEEAGAVLDLAHAWVALGGHLRRSGQRQDARDPLRHGLDLAHRVGAAPLAARAREELLAAGGRPRRPLVSGVEALTPGERRVASLAAQGLSNREIAERLFVAPRTVETHLHHAFDKLGVRKRDQLARHGLS